MSFTFQVDAVQYEEPGNTVLIGFLLTGEITERELLSVPTKSGTVFQSSIMAMEVEGPMAMPLPASQGSRIQLVLKGCPSAKDVVVPCEAVSVVPQEPLVVERSDLLDSPLFWAMWYYLHVGTDDVDSSELMQPFFGVSNKAVNEFYLETISKSEPQASWVSIRIPLPRGFSLAVEFAGEPYCEDRYILSHDNWDAKVLLGYHSGHFALPALRWHEVDSIERCVRATSKNQNHRRSALLLVFPAVYLSSQDETKAIRSTLVRAWQNLGLIPISRLPEMVNQIVDHKTIDDVLWRHDPDLGWVNDERHSLRNPKTRMCEFDRAKFERIREFTDMLDEYEAKTPP